MIDVVIVSACRTAIGSFGGGIKDAHACKIAGAAMKDAGIAPELINDARFG
jgi:acetyl-CoA C-acetyltransferase